MSEWDERVDRRTQSWTNAAFDPFLRWAAARPRLQVSGFKKCRFMKTLFKCTPSERKQRHKSSENTSWNKKHCGWWIWQMPKWKQVSMFSVECWSDGCWHTMLSALNYCQKWTKIFSSTEIKCNFIKVVVTQMWDELCTEVHNLRLVVCP